MLIYILFIYKEPVKQDAGIETLGGTGESQHE